MSAMPYYDAQALEFAKGALDLRKQRNRKRTVTGEYVWSEAADLVFALGELYLYPAARLIEWTKNPACRAGERRSFFLERFLRDRNIIKTRKQIASRLQVLKGEWSNTPCMYKIPFPLICAGIHEYTLIDQDLLRNPEDAMDSIRGSATPPLQEDYKIPPPSSLPTKVPLRTPYHQGASSLHVSPVPVTSTTSVNANQSIYLSMYSELRPSGHSAYHMPSYSTTTSPETRLESRRYAETENSSSYIPHNSVQSLEYPDSSHGTPLPHDYVTTSQRDYYPSMTGASSSPSY
ncbi:hypothetical protein Clacol_007264 [Clathrus columnatus]|uniref:Uncharacterized protein n=1 Tax=Clathrus columnatus TaxID=1419009 RepID=A0AAV5AM57_9AGAM|nr:hypothetical protein Clacol_007264 [Clathrus columnatus]